MSGAREKCLANYVDINEIWSETGKYDAAPDISKGPPTSSEEWNK